MGKLKDFPYEDLIGAGSKSLRVISTTGNNKNITWPPWITNMRIDSVSAGNIKFRLGNYPWSDYMGHIYTASVSRSKASGSTGSLVTGGPVNLARGYNQSYEWIMTPWGIAALV